ncbi:FolC bifunctional protein [Magnetococcus marinus MC-1]|uniref:Dihydrofolate synthase/folylpolyglutamate synthase n=1 Tax=Magnetococcus marinus (strain ATCC BAA-1437 / JCM 17883 / MC-1) TaxID=156889 RepID=A0LA36_MAGMM|nr:folylpolyglutamate synthase/dihydrofolate synthase family protein [Magnetococcus marinus]ABK44829.1 FolC bifunctional protein [Magnetococcus marinus MC-1]
MSASLSVLDALLAQSESRADCIIELKLARMLDLLQAMGNPQRRLGPVVHVAGTNGKGSVIAFFGAILRQAGRSVAAYTSPHLVTIHERIQYNGVPVEDALLRYYAQQVLALPQSQQATFFERLTATAFAVMAHWQASDPSLVVVLETGLGGRLDATNVVQPVLTAITAMGLDHQSYLGTSMAQIAQEKAGILKAGVPAVLAPAQDEALAVLVQQAQQVGAPVQVAGQDYRWGQNNEGAGWWYSDGVGQLMLPEPGLLGAHQYHNGAQAVAMVRQLVAQGWSVPSSAYAAGLTAVRWPGRLERVGDAPEVWLDGAHNPAGAQVCADFFRQYGRVDVMLFALMADKDVAGMLEPWLELVKTVVVVEPVGGRSMAAEGLAQAWRAVGVTAETAPSTEQGWQLARKKAGHAGKILVSGSLYLVGEVKKLL